MDGVLVVSLNIPAYLDCTNEKSFTEKIGTSSLFPNKILQAQALHVALKAQQKRAPLLAQLIKWMEGNKDCPSYQRGQSLFEAYRYFHLPAQDLAGWERLQNTQTETLKCEIERLTSNSPSIPRLLEKKHPFIDSPICPTDQKTEPLFTTQRQNQVIEKVSSGNGQLIVAVSDFEGRWVQFFSVCPTSYIVKDLATISCAFKPHAIEMCADWIAFSFGSALHVLNARTLEKPIEIELNFDCRTLRFDSANPSRLWVAGSMGELFEIALPYAGYCCKYPLADWPEEIKSLKDTTKHLIFERNSHVSLYNKDTNIQASRICKKAFTEVTHIVSNETRLAICGDDKIRLYEIPNGHKIREAQYTGIKAVQWLGNDLLIALENAILVYTDGDFQEPRVIPLEGTVNQLVVCNGRVMASIKKNGRCQIVPIDLPSTAPDKMGIESLIT